MKLEDVIKQKLIENPDSSFSQIAEIVQAHHTGEMFSHRTLRRKVAKVSRHESINDSRVPTTYNYKGEKPITSLAEAIDFFKIDLKKFEVTGYTCNAWDVTSQKGKKTNYQVKLTLKPREKEIDYKELRKNLDSAISTINVKRTPGTNHGVLCLADLHIGADIQNLAKTQDFNYKTVIEYLRKIADKVNEKDYKKVSIIFLGDFIESFTGLNHINSWKSMGKGLYGHHVVILAYEILRDFLAAVNNLTDVYMVAGNHDRSTSDAKHDNEGDVAGLLFYMVKQSYLNKKVNIEFSSIILNRMIDGIFYVMTHNHHGVSKGDIGKVFFEYGDQNSYNILLGGHWHSRKSKKVFHTLNETYLDQANYRAVDIAPLFTGNFYSESNGWTSNAGFSLIENNGNGKPNIFDYSL